MKRSPARPASVALAALLGAVPAAAAAPDPASFAADPRLEIRVWAAEPDVVDPVGLCFDEHGDAYVAECRDYPLGAGPGGAPGSTVRLLRRGDAPGRHGRVTVFADHLSYATAVTPWRGGVLVAAAPDILFLRDTDGDGVADVREVVATGFARGVSDSLVNGLCLGPDNRIHGANGGNGGRIRSTRRPDFVLALGEDDFSLDPDTGALAATGRSGGGFGLVFDDWGRAFTTYNINHLQHRYLSRADIVGREGFPPVETTASISDHEEMSRVFPVSAAATRPNHPEQSGRFSAAGGMGRLGAANWPADLRGSLFVCDVVGNLVHRDVVRAEGAALVASRAPSEQDREFVAGRDPACRPVGLVDGPDGALYLLDMQRDVIEHPDYIPAKARAGLDLRAGDDRGRIYRVVPSGTPVPTAAPARVGRDAALVALLSHGDAWWRTTARRLLVERRAVALAPRVRAVARDARDPRGRANALWTLDGLGALQPADLLRAADDREPRVRECALELAKRTAQADAALAAKAWERCLDPDARVRFEAILATATLPPAAGNPARSVFPRVIAGAPGDAWLRRAILAALPAGDRLDVLRSVARLAPADPAAARDLADLAGATPSLAPRALAELLPWMEARPSDAAVREAILEGLDSGLERTEAVPSLGTDAARALDALASRARARELRALWRLSRRAGAPDSPAMRAALDRARAAAADASRPAAERAGAVGLLGFGGTASDVAALLDRLSGTEPAAVQAAALDVLRGRKDDATGAALVARWRSLAPSLRPAALQLLLDRRAFHEPLVSALEQGRITVGELSLDLEQRRRLLRSGIPGIAARAAKLVGDEEYSNRKAVVGEWLARLPARGDAARGRALFAELCARCHRAGGIGERVGPELGAVSHRSAEDLVGNILDPNMAINPGFVAYQAETRDGETVVGLVAAETADSVTLVQAGGVRVTLARRNLARLESTGASLMPEGLEAGRTPQDLRDLVEFLQSGASR